jgi:hypothetical protein
MLLQARDVKCGEISHPHMPRLPSELGQLQVASPCEHPMSSSTLDATTAHCLPPRSTIAPAALPATHLDLRRPSREHVPALRPQFLPATKTTWQPCPWAIGGQEEGSEASNDRFGWLLSPGELSAGVQSQCAVWLSRESSAVVEI